jgi:hypothetical protein
MTKDQSTRDLRGNLTPKAKQELIDTLSRFQFRLDELEPDIQELVQRVLAEESLSEDERRQLLEAFEKHTESYLAHTGITDADERERVLRRRSAPARPGVDYSYSPAEGLFEARLLTLLGKYAELPTTGLLSTKRLKAQKGRIKTAKDKEFD